MIRDETTAKNASLLTFFRSVEADNGVLTVGVGTAGGKVVSQLRIYRAPTGRFAYIGFEDNPDFGDEEKVIIRKDEFTISPFELRRLAQSEIQRIRELLAGHRIVFLVGAVGGTSGAALMPLVAEVSKKSVGRVIAVAITPFLREKESLFFAGTTLRNLGKLSDGVVIVDNEEIMQAAGSMHIFDAYRIVNIRIAQALRALAGQQADKTVGSGLDRFVETVSQRGFAILAIFESAKGKVEEAVAGAIESLRRMGDPCQAEKVMIHLISRTGLSTRIASETLSQVGSIASGRDAQIFLGLTSDLASGTKAVIVSGGWKDPRHLHYDPIYTLLGDRQLDDDPDGGPKIEIEALRPIET